VFLQPSNAGVNQKADSNESAFLMLWQKKEVYKPLSGIPEQRL
jgi:hypothetical protein